MTKWVMFGESHFLGDLFDIIHSRGESLKAVVQNVPEKKIHKRLTLAERLGRLGYTVAAAPLSAFVPSRNEKYVVGFRGKKMEPMVEEIIRKHQIYFHPLVHPTAILQIGAGYKDGAIIDAGAILGPYSTLGKHVIVNRGAIVGHDTVVGNYSFLGPGAVLSGYVTLGEDVFVGSNATILPDIEIGNGAVIGAGAVVDRHIEPGAVVVGPRSRPEAR